MTNRLLRQEEIETLLNAQVPESYQPEEDAEISVEQTPPELLTDEEKDALGEVGNICMGSSSTTLSMLLNQPVNITSPMVTITTMEELFKSFVIPHISIYVHFTEGLSGYNLLIMQLKDAAVLADLMMGGDGINITEEITEIGVSAASEAMNQMIGSASTAMASMFGRTVNISPPETKIHHSPDELEFPEPGQVVVVWFKMTIGSILDTQIMQVMDIDTAKEEAGLILDQLLEAGGEEYSPVQEESQAQSLPDTGEETGKKKDNDRVLYEPEPAQQPAADVHGLNNSFSFDQQSHAETSGVRQPSARGPVPTPKGLEQERLNLILDIPLKVTVLLGRSRWPIKDILELTPGSVVELQSLVDEPVEVLVNGTLVAMGEVVVVNENFGVRLTNIIKPEERLQKLGK